jgi:hypothetical protein
MSQLALSNDINIITAEINSYKQVAGQAVFEIGSRLKHVKENDLTHGEWESWLSANVNFTDRQARRLIQVVEEFKTDDIVRIGSSKLFEVLQLSEEVSRSEFINEPHTIPSTGELKTVDEMTVKELREVKKALQEAEAAELRAKQAEAKYTLAVTQHSEQQEKLLAQIDELKKSKEKDSPATLKRIAELEAKADREHQLAQDNIRLQLDMKNMERDFAEKITKGDKEALAYSDLRKSLRSIINVVTMEHSNAKQQYRLIVGHKEANEAVLDFIKRFDPLIQDLFRTWRESVTITEGVTIDVGQTGTENSGIIEIGSRQGQNDLDSE